MSFDVRTDGLYGNLRFAVRDAGDFVVAIHSSGTNIVANTWYHVAIVRYGTTGLFFIDGVLQSTTGTDFGSTTIPNYTSTATIGWTDFGYCKGYLDEVRGKGIAVD